MAAVGAVPKKPVDVLVATEGSVLLNENIFVVVEGCCCCPKRLGPAEFDGVRLDVVVVAVVPLLNENMLLFGAVEVVVGKGAAGVKEASVRGLAFGLFVLNANRPVVVSFS